MSDEAPLESVEISCGELPLDDLAAFTLGEPIETSREDRIQDHLDGCERCMRQAEEMFQTAAALWAKDREPTDWDRIGRSVRDRLHVELEREKGGRMSESTPEVLGQLPQAADAEARLSAPELLYCLMQIKHEPEQKQLVAEWVVDLLRLPHGSAAFFDAGSSSRAVFQAYLKRLGGPLVNVTTNSFLILQEWINNPIAGQLLGRGFTVDSVGENLDTPHLAFYGNGIKEKLLSGTYRPSVVFIGTNGFGFEDGRLLFGFHAPAEAAAKSVLFQCPSHIKVILTTARKIGNVSGSVLDLFSIPVYEKGDWYLATTAPGDEEKEAYDRTLKDFRRDGATRLIKKGISFHWMEITRGSEGTIIARDRMEEDPTLGLMEAEAKARGRG